MNVYILTFALEADIQIRVVDKDTWDWVFNGTLTPALETKLRGIHSTNYSAFISSKTLDNERAHCAPPINGSLIYSLGKFLEYCRNNNINIIDEYIYC